MPKMKVIRDEAGAIINIGEWDYCVRRIPARDTKTGEAIYDPIEGGGFVPRMVQAITNPMPAGAKESTANIRARADGGLEEDL